MIIYFVEDTSIIELIQWNINKNNGGFNLKIIIPKELDLESTLNFCNIIDTNNDGVCAQEEYIYDYKDMSRVEPFGMLLIGSKIRWKVYIK